MRIGTWSKLTFIAGIFLQMITQTHGKAIDRFFESLGGYVNHSAPGAYHDQAAGYYTGGGYAIRQNNKVVTPINISLPRLGVGCNSLDMYFGSFSILTGQELVGLLRRIGTAAPTYAAQLYLRTKTSVIEGLTAQIRKYLQASTGQQLNACYLGQQIVGGLLPKGTAASEQICMDQKRSTNIDWFGARKHCDSSSSVNNDIELLKKQEKFKDLLMGEYNLVWHVLQKMDQYQGNEELAQFIMSVTGTLISKKEGERYRLKVIEARADQKDFIAAYLKGGATSILSCNDNEKCLAPTGKDITIQDDKAMKAKVMQKITDLLGKYQHKQNVTSDDIQFLNDAVNLPIYRYIQVCGAAGTHFPLQDAAEYMAAIILLSQFDRVMSEILEAIDMLQKIQLEDTAIAEFKKNLQSARSRVQAHLIGINNGSSVQVLNQYIQSIEQSIIARNS